MPRRITPKYNAVVLLSGGLDSALNLALAVKHRPPVLAVNFDYGQRSAAAEIKAARRLASFYGVPLRTVKLPWFKDLLPRAMVRKRASLPRRGGTDAVWVPNRNGVFVAVGAAFAEKAGAAVLIAGFNAEEAAAFPDNSSAFVAACNRALGYATRGRVRLSSYTARFRKSDIVTRAVRLGLPLEYVYPCYAEGPRPCGACASCGRTAAALKAVGGDELRRRVFD